MFVYDTELDQALLAFMNKEGNTVWTAPGEATEL